MFYSLPRKLNRLLSIALSLALVGILLFFITQLVNYTKDSQEEFIVREVELAAPPPPPPPPETTETVDSQPTLSSTNIMLNTSSVGLKFSQQPEIKNAKEIKIELPKFDFSKVDISKTLMSNFPEVDMKELDSIPRLVAGTPLAIPRELRRRGVTQVRVVLEVMIDEQGNAYLRKFIEAPYPEMKSVVRDYLKTVRFTPPTRHGLPVHAVYTWPLKFSTNI